VKTIAHAGDGVVVAWVTAHLDKPVAVIIPWRCVPQNTRFVVGRIKANDLIAVLCFSSVSVMHWVFLLSFAVAFVRGQRLTRRVSRPRKHRAAAALKRYLAQLAFGLVLIFHFSIAVSFFG
jgi:hypothetical protein